MTAEGTQASAHALHRAPPQLRVDLTMPLDDRHTYPPALGDKLECTGYLERVPQAQVRAPAEAAAAAGGADDMSIYVLRAISCKNHDELDIAGFNTAARCVASYWMTYGPRRAG